MTTEIAPGFQRPPCVRTSDGRLRSVGYEIELSGLTLDEISSTVVELFGGSVQVDSRFGQRVVGTGHGDFKIEVDATLLREEKYLELLDGLGLAPAAGGFAKSVHDAVEDLLDAVAAHVIPFEVVTAPIALDRMHELDELRHALRLRHARGTGASVRFAFGLHINPETPSLEVGSLLRHLRAFLLLYDWLVAQSDIDVSRWLSPYIEDFPEPYRRRVLEPRYAPDLETFTADYLRDSPTRNRPLDLLPVLALEHVDRIVAASEEPGLVSARPAFHYRLPNCRIDEPDWRISHEWNRWVHVEQLAANDGALAELRRRYLALEPQVMDLHRHLWLEQIRRFMEDPPW